jgi:acyl carrier protein
VVNGGTTPAATVSGASYAQARIHFLHTMAGQSAAFNIARAVDLEGDLDIGALAWGVCECAGRHEILRSCFRVLNGQLRQIVTPAGPGLAVIDLRSLAGRSGSQADDTLAVGLAQQEARKPFDLARGPLLRMTALLLGERRSLLLITLHHIIADGQSLDILLRELSALYTSRATGVPHRLPVPELQYVDYAAWQRQRVEGGSLDADADFWREQLRGLTALALPSDRPRLPLPAYEGRAHRFPLDVTLLARLKALARHESVSFFMVLLAGFAVLLHRSTGQTDIAVGSTTSSRTRPELVDMVGLFVNMLVFRIPVEGSMTLRDVVGAAGEVCLDAYQHQEVPFEQVVAHSVGDRREPAKHPLFQVVFQMLEDDDADLPMAGLRARVRQPDGQSGGFDLIWTVGTLGERATVCISYATSLFDHSTVTKMAANWLRVLEQMAEDPDRTVGTVGILPPPSGGGWNGRTGPVPATPVPVPETGHAPQRTHPASGAAVPAALTGLWIRVLGVPDAKPDVSFFAQGGQSLLATILITQVEEEFGVRVSLDEFFRQPTLSALAGWIRRERAGRHDSPSADV